MKMKIRSFKRFRFFPPFDKGLTIHLGKELLGT